MVGVMLSFHIWRFIDDVDMALQRSKMEEHREGKSLLERCDKLLHSIAEMNATDTQPSPVSVLDSSSFYKDESSSSSPSPVMKRSIDFKGTHSPRGTISHAAISL